MAILSKLARRDRQPEIMDQPGLAVAHHQDALRGLARINWMSASDSIVWGPIRRLAEQSRGQTIRVLDLACGGGDVSIRLERRARNAGLPIAFTGVDVSPTAIEFARAQAHTSGANIEFYPLDTIHSPLPADQDVIMCSLFLHHLDNEIAVDLLRRMAEAARSLVLVNDLIRSRVGYALAILGTRILSRSSIVHADGPQSVCAAFTMEEVRALATRAGLQGASVSWRWPFRFLLKWSRA